MNHLKPIMQQNFLEYASYVIVDRAIPDIRDGCKPVQRRILHTLFANEDGKFHKVANIIGEAMKLHPHGDASIGDALVVLANKEYFIEKQGNFGNVITGHAAAAARYIECRLTPLARQTLFNDALVELQNSYDGRRQEPTYLPAKLPVVLLLGTEGIAVGMATKILPHNFNELLGAQIAILKNEKFTLYPDFLHGGSADVAEYDDGRGKLRVRAHIEAVGDKKIVIRQIPYSTTTESVIASIEAAIQKDKVKISSIDDFTTDEVEIELTLARGTYADEVIPQLYAYTECETSISSNIVVIKNRHPVQMTVSEVLYDLTERLRQQVKQELEHELQVLRARQHWLILEKIFVEERIYKRIETAKSAEAMMHEVESGMQKYADQLLQPLQARDIERLLDIRIRRISAFDVAKNRSDADAVVAAIGDCTGRLKNLTKTTIAYLTGLIKTHGGRYPRRTKIATFTAIDRRQIARQNIKLSYDPDTGFFGSDVKGSQHQMVVSEYDLILAISVNGTFRVMSAQNKVLLGKVLYLALFDAAKSPTITLVYRDAKRLVFAKKFVISKFVRNRTYRLLADSTAKVVFLSIARAGTVRLSYVPGARQAVREVAINLDGLEAGSVAAKGIRLAPKPALRLRFDGQGIKT